MKKIKLLLIDGNRLFRNGIIAMLKEQKDIHIIAASGIRKSTFTDLKRSKPDIILLNIGLQNRNSLKKVEIVNKDFPLSKVIVMDLSPVRGDISNYVKAGASGLILRDSSFDDFLNIIRSVAEGKNVFPKLLTSSLFSQIIENSLKSGKAKLRDAVRMTKREKEVIELIAEGFENNEISKKLNLTVDAVKNNIHNIMEKLLLHTRLESSGYKHTEKVFKLITENMPGSN